MSSPPAPHRCAPAQDNRLRSFLWRKHRVFRRSRPLRARYGRCRASAKSRNVPVRTSANRTYDRRRQRNRCLRNRRGREVYDLRPKDGPRDPPNPRSHPILPRSVSALRAFGLALAFFADGAPLGDCQTQRPHKAMSAPSPPQLWPAQARKRLRSRPTSSSTCRASKQVGRSRGEAVIS